MEQMNACQSHFVLLTDLPHLQVSKVELFFSIEVSVEWNSGIHVHSQTPEKFNNESLSKLTLLYFSDFCAFTEFTMMFGKQST